MRGSPVRNTSSGILRLVAKLPPGIELRPRERAILNSSSSVGAGQHDEAALGAADFDRRIEHQRQHVVEDAARAERAQPFEERGNLPQVANGRGRRLVDGGRVVGEQEHHLGAAAASEPDPIAVHERLLGDLLTVDVGAVARVLVADEERVVLGIDLGVIARDLAAGKSEVVGLAPPDLEVSFRDRNDAAAERVGHFKAGIGHENRNYCTIRTFRNAAATWHSETHRRRKNPSSSATIAAPRLRPAASCGSSGLAAVRETCQA